MKKKKKLSDPFIFNLGRVWQSALREDWKEAERLCDFIEEISGGRDIMKHVRKAILKEDTNRVDKQLTKILGW